MDALASRRRLIAEDSARVREAMGGRGASALVSRERVALEMIALGMSNREIGEAMRIGMTTVREYAKRIHDKTAIPGRARLAVAAARVIEARA